MKYLLANLVSGEVEKYQQSIVRELAEKFDTHWLDDYWTPAHFTLKGLFDEKHVHHVEGILERFTENNKAFPVLITKFSCYKDAILINVDLSTEAYDTYMALICELKSIENLEWGEYEAEKRKFHLSVALFDVEKHYEDMCNYVNSIDYHFTSSFNNIALLEQNDKGWIIRRFFLLK